jgi:hypothetical protein
MVWMTRSLTSRPPRSPPGLGRLPLSDPWLCLRPMPKGCLAMDCAAKPPQTTIRARHCGSYFWHTHPSVRCLGSVSWFYVSGPVGRGVRSICEEGVSLDDDGWKENICRRRFWVGRRASRRSGPDRRRGTARGQPKEKKMFPRGR